MNKRQNISCAHSHPFNATDENRINSFVRCLRKLLKIDLFFQQIYEGEHKKLEENNILDSYTLPDNPSLPKGDVCVNVTFNIDANGILQVNAIEKKTRKSLIKVVDKGK